MGRTPQGDQAHKRNTHLSFFLKSKVANLGISKRENAEKVPLALRSAAEKSKRGTVPVFISAVCA